MTVTVSARASAADAATARTRALGEARRRAFEDLLRDLSASVDHDRLPRVDDARIEDLVLSFEIREEKRSSTDYRALVDWHFDSGKVRALLEDSAIPYTLSPAAPLVVIPILRYAGTDILWEKGNAWHRAWRERPASLLLPLSVPEGDFGDMMTIHPRQALSHDCAALRAMMRRYGSGGFLIAVATPRFDADGATVVTVDLRRDARSVGPKRLILEVRETGPLDEALTVAVARALRVLGDEWKRLHAIVDEPAGQGIRIEANFTALSQWLEMKNAMETLSRRMKVRALSPKKAWLDVLPRGSASAFGYNLKARGWTIEDRDGRWNVQADADDTPPEWGAC